MVAVSEKPIGKIIAVVITVDRADTASRCVAALFDGSRTPDAVVVVDNGSTPPFVLPSEYRNKARVVRLEHNSGPAGGASAGQRAALDDGADWVWMIDDDAVVEPDALETLIEAAQDGETSHYFRAVCYNATSRDVPFYNSFVYNRVTGLLRPVPRECYAAPRFPFDACSMAGLFVSAALLQVAGTFDASLFGWYDDTEFTLRATLSGFHGYAIPASRVLHPSANRRSVSVLGRSFLVLAEDPQRLYYGTRNCILTQRRLLTRARFAFLFIPTFVGRRLVSIVVLYNNRRAFLRCFLRGVADGLHGRHGELVSGGQTA